jgi:hypothetical protein
MNEKKEFKLVKESEAYKATWANHILPIFSRCEVIRDDSDCECRYDGYVDIDIKVPRNNFSTLMNDLHGVNVEYDDEEDEEEDDYEYLNIKWKYGSCDVCDKKFDMNHVDVIKRLLDGIITFSKEEYYKWRERVKDNEKQKVEYYLDDEEE